MYIEQLSTAWFKTTEAEGDNMSFPVHDGPPRTWPVSTRVICGLLMPLDFVIVLLAAGVAYAVRFWNVPLPDPFGYALTAGAGALLAVNLFHFGGMYKDDILRKRLSTLGHLTLYWFGAAAALTTVAFLAKTSDEYSRLWSIAWFGIGMAMLLGTRVALFVRASRWVSEGRLRHNIAIVGRGPLAVRAARHLQREGDEATACVGIYTDADAVPTGQSGNAIQGTIDDLIEDVRAKRIDTVMLVMPNADERRLNNVLARLIEVPVDVRLCPGPAALQLAGHGVSHYAGLPTIDVVDRPIVDWDRTRKDFEDIVLGALITLLILPVMTVIAIAIKLDSPGPVFFRQKRHGFNNELIDVFKFRTMHSKATDWNGNQLTRKNDPRITRVGAFLRSTSLDELPQFLNVLRGEMSIVGPRPHAIASKADGTPYRDAVPLYDARHRVKPGITGWAQINGWRGPTETVRQIRKRVEFDLYYIENWSVWFDLKIIFLTIFKGFVSRNAY